MAATDDEPRGTELDGGSGGVPEYGDTLIDALLRERRDQRRREDLPTAPVRGREHVENLHGLARARR
jgi:hypothetical protein